MTAPCTPGAKVRQSTLNLRCPAAKQELANRLVPTLVPRQLLGGARVGRCHGLRAELALAFAEGAGAGGGRGGRMARRRRRGERRRDART
jgi:hypothetical protein